MNQVGMDQFRVKQFRAEGRCKEEGLVNDDWPSAVSLENDSRYGAEDDQKRDSQCKMSGSEEEQCKKGSRKSGILERCENESRRNGIPYAAAGKDNIWHKGKRWQGRLCRGNLLDEMQEQKLLHIEKNSFWFLYGMLFLAIIIQIGMGGRLREAGAEMICFLTVSVFMVFSCLWQGIWDRRLRADWKTNLKVSCISALIVALCSFLGIPNRNLSTKMFIGVTIMCIAVTFVVTFSVLGICSHFYRRRKEALENGEDD